MKKKILLIILMLLVFYVGGIVHAQPVPGPCNYLDTVCLNNLLKYREDANIKWMEARSKSSNPDTDPRVIEARQEFALADYYYCLYLKKGSEMEGHANPPTCKNPNEPDIQSVKPQGIQNVKSNTQTVDSGYGDRIVPNPSSDTGDILTAVGGAGVVIVIISKLIGLIKGAGGVKGAGAGINIGTRAGGGLEQRPPPPPRYPPRPPIKGRITDNPAVQTPPRKPPPPLRRIQQTPEEIRIEQRQIEEMEVRKKEIQENMKESEKEASRQKSWANFWDWMSYGAEKVQSGADLGVDVLSNVTGPAGQNIKKIYTVTKDLSKNMSEGYASGTGVWEGAKKGAAEAATDLVLDYGTGKITDLTGGKIPGLKKFENAGNDFGYDERSLSYIKNVLTAKPDDAADELKQIIMKNAFKNAGKSTAQGFGQGYVTDPIKKVMGNKIGYDF